MLTESTSQITEPLQAPKRSERRKGNRNLRSRMLSSTRKESCTSPKVFMRLIRTKKRLVRKERRGMDRESPMEMQGKSKILRARGRERLRESKRNKSF